MTDAQQDNASGYWTGKTYWIIGASAGLGAAIAKQLSAKGARLILSARGEDALKALASELPGEAQVAPCDVRNRNSVSAAFSDDTPIDGLVFCAGVYEPIRAQDWDPEAIETMCDINFTGCARVLGAALPGMLSRGHGHITLIGSLAGSRGLPSASGYGASKAGVMHMAESLKADLGRRFKVQVINPGFIETRLTAKNTFKMPFIMSPEDAAARCIRAMETRRFQTWFPTRFALVFKLLKWLPDGLYFPIARSMTPRDKSPEHTA